MHLILGALCYVYLQVLKPILYQIKLLVCVTDKVSCTENQTKINWQSKCFYMTIKITNI